MSTYVPDLRGTVDAEGLRIGIVVSRFNEHITRLLLDGALEILEKHGALKEDIRVCWVPGAFEIGAAAAAMAERGDVDAIVCLGCVIRGETPHFDFVCRAVTDAVVQLSLQWRIGFGFGVLTVENEAQGLDRAGGTHGHKGMEAALVAVEMARLLKALR